MSCYHAESMRAAAYEVVTLKRQKAPIAPMAIAFSRFAYHATAEAVIEMLDELDYLRRQLAGAENPLRDVAITIPEASLPPRRKRRKKEDK